jgi:hypothetical protein
MRLKRTRYIKNSGLSVLENQDSFTGDSGIEAG